MLTLLTPGWLIGLALLPVIRWLHRGGHQRRAVPVSHLALWRGSEAGVPAASGHRPPDPAWRRRALLTALLLVALAGPQLQQQHLRVTLWVDDSISMLTREEHGTRLALGLAQVRALLAAAPTADVEVRSLGDPWRGRGAFTDASAAAIVAGAGLHEPLPPPAALLRSDAEQWLLTDGADATLFRWPGDRRPDRVIQIAGVTRNVGLERLSARRHPDDPQVFDLLLKVSNGGTAAETRVVVFAADAVEVARSTVQLAPGASALVAASAPASALVRATLQPADALPEDDEIALDLAPLRQRRVAVDPTCPTALRAAVATHPALAPSPAGVAEPDAVLDCGNGNANGNGSGIKLSGGPVLRVLADNMPTQLTGQVQWSASVPEERRIDLDTAPLWAATRLQVPPGDAVLLAIGGQPVIVERATSKHIEVALDVAALGATRGPELPLLVDLLFEHLFDRRLLDEIAVVTRGPGEARVTPLPRDDAAGAAPVARAVRQGSDATRPWVLLALPVLLWEIVVLGRRRFRRAAPAQAAAG